MTLELGTSKPKALDAAGVLKQWPNGGLWKGNLGVPKTVKTCIATIGMLERRHWEAECHWIRAGICLFLVFGCLSSLSKFKCVLRGTRIISYAHISFCQFALTLLYVEQKGGSRDRWKSGQWSTQERKILRENTSYFECQKKTTTTCAFQKLCFLIPKNNLFFSQKLGVSSNDDTASQSTTSSHSENWWSPNHATRRFLHQLKKNITGSIQCPRLTLIELMYTHLFVQYVMHLWLPFTVEVSNCGLNQQKGINQPQRALLHGIFLLAAGWRFEKLRPRWVWTGGWGIEGVSL